jgi:hypothetical protein
MSGQKSILDGWRWKKIFFGCGFRDGRVLWLVYDRGLPAFAECWLAWIRARRPSRNGGSNAA